MAVVLAFGVAGCAETGAHRKHAGFHEYETHYLEQHEHVGHAEADREATEAEELAERIQRSGIKTGS